MPKHSKSESMHSMRVLCALVVMSGAACAHTPPVTANRAQDEVLPHGVPVATFDSLWSKVANSYVDTSFVSHEWKAVRDSLRPRAQAITKRSELDALLAQTLGHIHDSHFYIIPAHVAPEESQTTSDARGTTGLAVRAAEGKIVAWRVEPGSAAAVAGIKPGDVIERISGRNADSALRRVAALPVEARPRALSEMLHHLNGFLNADVGDTVRVATSSKSFSLVARASSARLSQFGNLPPLPATVTESRIPTTGGGCAGVIALSIWLPEMSRDLDKAVNDERECQGIIIDLRGNPGGVGAMVMGFAGYFVDSMKSLGTMRTRLVSLNFVINPRANPYKGKVAIIVDPMSASTSEIFATGMQRIGRARVFGEQSATAALPALMERLPSGDVFVHAVADFVDPAGKRVEGAGVSPDVIVPVRIADVVQGRDAPIDAAVQWIEKGAQ